MDNYVTGGVIRKLREDRGITQEELANQIGVTGKAVSKWETGKGLPDISLLQPLGKALGVSVEELLNGIAIKNKNLSGNMLRTKIYICPVCGNLIFSVGSAVVSCCGVTLPETESDEEDEDHKLTRQRIEDEEYITIHHPMTKDHYISFCSYVGCDRIQTVKFYPEGDAAARFKFLGGGYLYYYCNRHGLIRVKV